MDMYVSTSVSDMIPCSVLRSLPELPGCGHHPGHVEQRRCLALSEPRQALPEELLPLEGVAGRLRLARH